MYLIRNSAFAPTTATIRGRFSVVGETSIDSCSEQEFIGEIIHDSIVSNSAKIEFNRSCKKWTYDWVGDRFSTKEHYFVVTVQHSAGTSDEIHLHTFTGPRFKIVSARRTDLSEMCFPLLYEGALLTYIICIS
jgi:hypothetical protein